MCGITGFWLTQPSDDSKSTIRKMCGAIAHRGPDSSGVWENSESTLFLGHQRLAIQDLSSAGAQPMRSRSGRFLIVFNGEIYNHLELRVSLKAEVGKNDWLGTSDTETLLAAIECWGIEKTLLRVNGMFAFAIWDSKKSTLYLARDRLGEKPLYFGVSNEVFLFGSELKALKSHPQFHARIDRQSLVHYFQNSNVPAPHSIYEGIKKLPPGCWIELVSPRQEAVCKRYWDLNKLVVPESKICGYDVDEVKKRLREQLNKSVMSRMVSDVPLGAFLSGGYDSSLVTAIMQRNSSDRINTYSIGFDNASYNEAVHAKAVASALGTRHNELYIQESDARDVVPGLNEIWDEPFSDPSQIPTFLLSKMTRNEVTVALSGDGGDELFCGYERYVRALKIWNRQNALPAGLTKRIAKILSFTSKKSKRSLDSLSLFADSRFSPLLSVTGSYTQMLAKHSRYDTYLHTTKNWKDGSELVIGSRPIQPVIESDFQSQLSTVQLMTSHDIYNYLPDAILTKVDRASMAVGLETRAPLLDHELVEMAFQISDSLKLQPPSGKQILKDLTHELVPEEIMSRPKMGFGVPIGEWLRVPLRDWASDLLSPSLIRRQGYLNPDLIEKMWKEHQSRQWNWEYYLWDILMFQQWIQSHNDN